METKRAPAGIVSAAAFLAVWAMLNPIVAPRRIAAGIVGAAAFLAVWTMTNYIVAQIGSGSPELACTTTCSAFACPLSLGLSAPLWFWGSVRRPTPNA